MVQTAQPVTGPSSHRTIHPRCPDCGIPIDGIAAVEPGRNVFSACGHEATGRFVDRLTVG